MWGFFPIFAKSFNNHSNYYLRLLRVRGISGAPLNVEMNITAKELAGLTGGFVQGDPDASVSTFAKIEEAEAGALTFLANPKYTHYLYSTHASVAIVAEDFEPEKPLPEGLTLLRVKDPYESLAQLMSMVQSAMPQPVGIEQPCFIAEGVEVPENAYIGAFAYIGKGVRLAPGVKLYPQTYVGDGVEIGEDTILYAGARIYPHCRVGARCIIHSGAVIGADGFGFAPSAAGYEKIPQMGIVEIADDVEVGANTTIDRATMGATRVGRGTKLDNLIQVAHNVVIGEHNVFAAQTGIAGSARLGDWNMFGGQVGVAGHISIGSRNQVGAQSGLHRSMGDGNKLMGTPAVGAKDFARLQVYLKKLPEMYEELRSRKKN